MDTILIIDDEPRELELLREMLADGSFQFQVAGTADDARRLIDEHGDEIKAVLLDWILDGIDGVELLRWLQTHPALADVEVVVQSAEFNREYIRAGLECGAYYYLTKPFEPPQLRAIVRAAVEACELKRTLARRIEECENAVRLMTRGTFRLRTRRQAETLAVYLGSVAGDPQHGVGLLELLVNAVEHGNLEISYEEKGRLLAEDRFEQEVDRRLALPELRDRRVEVAVERRDGQLEILIADGGDGFDFRRYLEMDRDRLFDAHGRGVLLASAAFELEYLEPGNRVRVFLPLKPAA